MASHQQAIDRAILLAGVTPLWCNRPSPAVMVVASIWALAAMASATYMTVSNVDGALISAPSTRIDSGAKEASGEQVAAKSEYLRRLPGDYGPEQQVVDSSAVQSASMQPLIVSAVEPIKIKVVVPAGQEQARSIKLPTEKQSAVYPGAHGKEVPTSQQETLNDLCQQPFEGRTVVSMSSAGVRTILPGQVSYWVNGAECVLKAGGQLGGEQVVKVDAELLRIHTAKRTIQLVDK